jgi:hypothetical protein
MPALSDEELVTILMDAAGDWARSLSDSDLERMRAAEDAVLDRLRGLRYGKSA